jgi:hypothetical protein
MPYELHHMYRVVERALDYVCVQRAFKEAGELPCYWTAAANLRHIDRTRLTDEQFRSAGSSPRRPIRPSGALARCASGSSRSSRSESQSDMAAARLWSLK